VVEAAQAAGGVDRDADRVEAQLQAVRPVGDLAEEGRGHAADLLPLALVEAVPRSPGPAARLDLDEDEVSVVGGDDVDLAEPRPVVAGDDVVAEALEVLDREALGRLPEEMTLIG
jgi:hypothetical protein